MAVGLYLRVSTSEQAEEGYSIGEQEKRLRAYADAMQWDVYKVYIDPGYTGGNMDRPGLTQMIKDIQHQRLDRVLVYRLDRLSRDQLDTLYLIQKVFLPNKVDFVSMSESFDTSTPFGRATVGILAVFAQLEKENIRERMKMGKEGRAKEGKWNGGTEPIGYDYSIADDRLIVNEYEQMQIRELRELFLSNMPLRTIETLFREKGYRHKHGLWTPLSMRRVLRSRIYLGELSYKGVWYKGTHEATLDEETYEKLLKKLDKRAERYALSGVKPGAHTTYLGGILWCKRCGARYAKQIGKKWKGNPAPRYYTCYSRSHRVKKMITDPTCKNKNWKGEELENIVFNEIRKLAIDPEYLHEIAEANHRTRIDPEDNIKVLKTEIEKLDSQISRLLDLYSTGKFTIDQIIDRTDPLNQQKQALQTELQSIQAEKGLLLEDEAIEMVRSFDEILESGDFNNIRELIQALIERIEIDGDDVYIYWKFA